MVARYDDAAASYAAVGDHYEGAAVSALLGLVSPAPGARVLDLACGHGPIARELARRGARVTGVDLSEALLDRARSWDPDDDVAIDYVRADVADPALLHGESFDLIVCNFGLSDIDDLDGTCETVARLLVPGGRFVFSILHPCFAGAPQVSGSWPTGRTYYDEGFWRADGELSVLRKQVGANHRMLSTYINALVRHGLAVEVMNEPRPEPEWADARPGVGAQPVYLVVRCIRGHPGSVLPPAADAT